jgi:AcrR family transcriptional regulator
MGEIAAKVQMAKGNLYYYFPSKQDLLFFCQDESLGRLLDQASAISNSRKRADDQLRDMIIFHVKTILEELPGSTAHTDFRSLPSPLLRKVIQKRDRYEEAYRSVIERGMKRGVFRKCNVKTAVWAILGSLNWSVQWFSPKGEITVDRLGQEFADLFVNALRK